MGRAETGLAVRGRRLGAVVQVTGGVEVKMIIVDHRMDVNHNGASAGRRQRLSLGRSRAVMFEDEKNSSG